MQLEQHALLAANIHNTDALCQQYLNVLYHNMQGHKISSNQNKVIAETYGEILYEGIQKLFAEIPISEQDVFVDLGSGLGKVVVQAFLNSPVKESCGIEIVPELHQQALLVAQTVRQDLPDFYTGGRKLTFLSGSFLEIPLAMASIVLIASPCYGQKILSALGEMIDRTPGIHSALTLRPIFNLKRLTFIKTIRIECSWDTALCYVYRDKKIAQPIRR